MTRICKDGRVWGQNNKEAGTHLGILGKDKETEIKRHKRYYQAHRTQILEYHQRHKTVRTQHYWEYRAQLKKEVLTHYGDGQAACVKCGYNDSIAALSIDHIDGGGVKHRQTLGVCGGRQFYVWLKNNGFPDGYQTLCMNCQYIKRAQQKEYGSGGQAT